MQNPSFQNINLNPLVKPVNELVALNIKTIQSFSYITPAELLNVRNPEDIVQKNMNVLIKNSNTVIEYVQDVFHLWEKSLFHNMDNLADPIKAPMKQAAKTIAPKMSRAVKVGRSLAREGVSHLKDTKKIISKAAKSSVKKASGSSVNKIKKASQSMQGQAKKITPAKHVVKGVSPSVSNTLSKDSVSSTTPLK